MSLAQLLSVEQVTLDSTEEVAALGMFSEGSLAVALGVGAPVSTWRMVNGPSTVDGGIS